MTQPAKANSPVIVSWNTGYEDFDNATEGGRVRSMEWKRAMYKYNCANQLLCPQVIIQPCGHHWTCMALLMPPFY